MRYTNEILNRIVIINKSNSLGLDNITSGYITMMKNGSKIHIKEKNKGKFTAASKRDGQEVQAHAHNVMNDPNATTLQKRRAQFAINAKSWNKK